MTKFIFIATPQFGATILQGLIENNYKPILVITAPDKPAGRKKILTPSQVKLTAQKYKIPLIQPLKIKPNDIKNLKPDLIISAAYGQIIPKQVLEMPKYKTLGVHPSLLPKYRGPSPIQTAILNGDKKIGTTIYLMNEKIDQGPIAAQAELLFSNENYQELSQKLAELSAQLLIKTIPKWLNKEIKARAQDELRASYTKIIKKEDAEIDWKKSAQEIERQIRAFDPWPGTFTFVKKKGKRLRIKILEAEVSEKEKPSQLCIKCAQDYLLIKKLQLEGKKPVKAEDFLKGNYDILF